MMERCPFCLVIFCVSFVVYDTVLVDDFQASIKGKWTFGGGQSACISDEGLTLSDGSFDNIILDATSRTLELRRSGILSRAELRADGKLHWDSKEIWERQTSVPHVCDDACIGDLLRGHCKILANLENTSAKLHAIVEERREQLESLESLENELFKFAFMRKMFGDLVDADDAKEGKTCEEYLDLDCEASSGNRRLYSSHRRTEQRKSDVKTLVVKYYDEIMNIFFSWREHLEGKAQPQVARGRFRILESVLSEAPPWDRPHRVESNYLDEKKIDVSIRMNSVREIERDLCFHIEIGEDSAFDISQPQVLRIMGLIGSQDEVNWVTELVFGTEFERSRGVGIEAHYDCDSKWLLLEPAASTSSSYNNNVSMLEDNFVTHAFQLDLIGELSDVVIFIMQEHIPWFAQHAFFRMSEKPNLKLAQVHHYKTKTEAEARNIFERQVGWSSRCSPIFMICDHGVGSRLQDFGFYRDSLHDAPSSLGSAVNSLTVDIFRSMLNNSTDPRADQNFDKILVEKAEISFKNVLDINVNLSPQCEVPSSQIVDKPRTPQECEDMSVFDLETKAADGTTFRQRVVEIDAPGVSADGIKILPDEANGGYRLEVFKKSWQEELQSREPKAEILDRYIGIASISKEYSCKLPFGGKWTYDGRSATLQNGLLTIIATDRMLSTSSATSKPMLQRHPQHEEEL